MKPDPSPVDTRHPTPGGEGAKPTAPHGPSPGFEEIRAWLREEDEGRLAGLWRRADETRRHWVGDEVHLRGLVEISSHCRRLCAYCGLRAANTRLARYRMGMEDILACAQRAESLGFGTLVMQSGEDPGIGAEWLAELIRQVRARTGLAVTLSLGERDPGELSLWREAGADRYLLRFETSNPELFRRIHPPVPGGQADRIGLLRTLRTLGYETGSGVMVGIPGQSFDDLARDILLFHALELDMIGVGPFIPHPDTPLGAPQAGVEACPPADPGPGARDDDQVPNSVTLTLKTLALARLVCPWANIPSTTALAALDPEGGRERGLRCGANVVMPNLTPPACRAGYEIYPGKACPGETVESGLTRLLAQIRDAGRRPGTGPGPSRRLEGALGR